jgi:hypothetical protein
MSTTTNFPPLPTWAAYTEAVQAYEGLHDDLREAHRLLDSLRGVDRDAAKQDDAAQASALRAGKADPGRKASVKWKNDLAAAKDRVRVLEAAVQQQEQAVQALVRSDREQAAQAAQEARQEAAERYRRSLADVVDARDAFFQTGRALAWAEHGGAVRLKVQSAPGLNVPSARTLNGEPLPVAAVLNALAAEADETAGGAAPTRFMTGAAQPPAEPQQVRITIPDPSGTGPGRVVVVDPEDRAAYARAKAEQSAALLARDARENAEAAAMVAAQQDQPA